MASLISDGLGFDRDLLYERRLQESQPKQTVFRGKEADRVLSKAVEMGVKGMKWGQRKPEEEKTGQKFSSKIPHNVREIKGLSSEYIKKYGAKKLFENADRENDEDGEFLWRPDSFPRHALFAAAGVDEKAYEKYVAHISGWADEYRPDVVAIRKAAGDLQKGNLSNPLTRALAVESQITQAVLGKGSTVLFRGVRGDEARQIERASGTLSVKLAPAQSFTSSKSVAKGFASGESTGEGGSKKAGYVIATRIPNSAILISHKTNKRLKEKVGEEEYIVSLPKITVRNPKKVRYSDYANESLQESDSWVVQDSLREGRIREFGVKGMKWGEHKPEEEKDSKKKATGDGLSKATDSAASFLDSLAKSDEKYVVLLTGTNGSGKSSIAKGLLGKFEAEEKDNRHEFSVGDKKVAVAGTYTPGKVLSGPDAIPKEKFYSQIASKDFADADIVIIDGQKFAHGKDFERIQEFAKKSGRSIKMLVADVSPETALERTKSRGIAWSPTLSAIKKQREKIFKTAKNLGDEHVRVVSTELRKEDFKESRFQEARKSGDKDLKNLGRVTKTIYRGGLPTAEGLKRLKDMGVALVIDLHDSGIASERKAVKQLGMKFLGLPWSTERKGLPSMNQIRAFLKALRKESKRGKVYVHCRQGRDRTGTMLALFRMIDQHWNLSDVMREMRSYDYKDSRFPYLTKFIKSAAEQILGTRSKESFREMGVKGMKWGQRRGESPAERKEKAHKLLAPSGAEIQSVKVLADKLRKKDPTDAEWLDNIHDVLTYEDPTYGKRPPGDAKRYLKDLSSSTLAKLPENLVKFIKTGSVGKSRDEEDVEESFLESSRPERIRLATRTHIPQTKRKYGLTKTHEAEVAEAFGGKTSRNQNSAFDVYLPGKHVVEVKTIVEGKRNVVTMHPQSLLTKKLEAFEHGYIPHTLVFDKRRGKEAVYYKGGLGSFRLGSMRKMESLEEARSIFAEFGVKGMKWGIRNIGQKRALDATPKDHISGAKVKTGVVVRGEKSGSGYDPNTHEILLHSTASMHDTHHEVGEHIWETKLSGAQRKWWNESPGSVRGNMPVFGYSNPSPREQFAEAYAHLMKRTEGFSWGNKSRQLLAIRNVRNFLRKAGLSVPKEKESLREYGVKGMKWGERKKDIEDAIRNAGGEPLGATEHPKGGHLVMFNDPKTKSTLALMDDEINEDSVKNQISQTRAKFAKGDERRKEKLLDIVSAHAERAGLPTSKSFMKDVSKKWGKAAKGKESRIREFGTPGMKWGVHKPEEPSPGREKRHRKDKRAKRLREEEKLRTLPVRKTKRLGGGVNETHLVYLQGGGKAVFKPKADDGDHRNDISGGYGIEREAGAWEVAKIGRVEDMVAPVVVREINGVKGSLMKFRDGRTAAAAASPEEAFDGDEDLHRAAVFDYVIGNEDRHKGNWLIDDGRLKLIDHGLSFPDRHPYSTEHGNQKLVSEVISRELGRGKSSVSPNKAAKAFISGKDEILKALGTLGLPEKALEGVGKRIDKLAKAKTWRELILDE